MSEDTIVIKAPAGTKSRWVRQSQSLGMKLSDWVVKRVGFMSYEFNGFSLSIDAFIPFERYVRALSDDDARALLRAVKAHDAAQADAVAAIKIAHSYLEKRVCIANGIADTDMFHDINVDALGFYHAAPDLTHIDLMKAIL